MDRDAAGLFNVGNPIVGLSHLYADSNKKEERAPSLALPTIGAVLGLAHLYARAAEQEVITHAPPTFSADYFLVNNSPQEHYSIRILDSDNVSIRFLDLDENGANVFEFHETNSSQSISVPDGWTLSILKIGILTGAPKEEDRLKPLYPGQPERFRLAEGDFCQLWRPDSNTPFFFQSPKRARSLSSAVSVAEPINAIALGPGATMSMTLTGVVANAPVTSLRPSLKRTSSQMLEKSEEKKVHCHLTSSFLSSAESFLKWTKEFVPVEQSFRYVLALNKNSLVTLAHLPPARHRTSSSTELNSTCIDVDLPTTSSKTNFDSHTSTEGLEVESGLTSPLTNLPTDWDRTPSPFIRPHHIIEPFQDSKRTATI